MESIGKPNDPLGRFALSIFWINGLLLRTGDRLTRSIGQSSARWQVLGRVGYQPQTVAQIARDMGHARQSVQRVADVLAKEGLVVCQDNPANRRSPLLELTPHGAEMLRMISSLNEEWARHIMTKLNPEQLDAVADALEEIAHILEADEQQTSQQETRKNDPAKVVLGAAFTSYTVQVRDASVQYVSGGSGPAIIFLHGFSQDWYEFRQVMCLLAHRYTVLAVDLRGIGKSKATRADYDAETLANDIHELVGQLALKDPYIVGHDMGGMIAYAYARLYPTETRGIALLDGPLPGTPSTDLMVKLPFLWHFAFHRLPKLPEWLIGGREYTYFKRAFFLRFAKDKQAMTDADMRHYASAYTLPEQLRAGLGLYRTYQKNWVFMISHRDELHVPILLLEGDYGSGKPGRTAKELATTFGCRNVIAQVVVGCGHFMADEQPQVIADLLQSKA